MPKAALTFNLDGTLPYKLPSEKLSRRVGLRVAATASGPWLILVYSVTPTPALQRDLDAHITIGLPEVRFRQVSAFHGAFRHRRRFPHYFSASCFSCLSATNVSVTPCRISWLTRVSDLPSGESEIRAVPTTLPSFLSISSKVWLSIFFSETVAYRGIAVVRIILSVELGAVGFPVALLEVHPVAGHGIGKGQPVVGCRFDLVPLPRAGERMELPSQVLQPANNLELYVTA